MNNIELLLNDINSMFPISTGFRNDLSIMMTQKQRKSGYVFLKSGTLAVKAWQLINGFILVINSGPDQKEIVERIYYPRQIVTDLRSFFQGIPTRATFVAVGDVMVLEIKKADVIKLQKYAETQKLVQHLMLMDTKAADLLVQMFRLPVPDRVAFFLKNYKANGLAYKYCASLLNLSEDEYLENKIILENSGVASIAVINPEEHLKDATYIAYKIKLYILKNLSSPDFGDTREIAAHFYITDRTLNRLFTKTFGTTVNKFIFKGRMEKAYELLNDNGAHVGETAIAVGYKNIYHFSRSFKKHFGHSPRDIKGL